MKCPMRKTTSHKGSSLCLPHHLFIPLNCTLGLQEACLSAWERYLQSDIIPLQVLQDFIFVFLSLGYVAVAQFLPCWSKELQAAMHPEGFLVPAIPLFTFLCKPGCLSHLPLSGKPPTRLEYFLISSQICPPVLGRFPRSPFPSRQETLKLPNSSANSSTLNSCWHFSLSLTLGTVSHSKESLFLNPHLLESKWDILYFH